MANQNGRVVKIYELKTLGFDSTLKEIDTLAAHLRDCVKLMKELKSQKLATQDSAELAAINRELQKAAVLEAEIKLQLKQKSTALKEAKLARLEEVQATEKQTRASKVLTVEEIKNREEAKRLNAENKNLALDSLAAANSIEKLRAQLAIAVAKRNKLQIDSEEFKAAEKDVLALNTRLKELEAKGGDFRRNVGNYASGFDGIRNSLNQLTREAPAFANSIQTGFLAISNNIPIFFDEIAKANREIAALREQGKETQGILGRLAGAFFSFGTVLSIGVTLLTVYGKEIGDFISSIFKGTKALNEFTERQRILNETLKSGAGYKEAIQSVKELTINIDLAKRGILDKTEVVKQYNETIGKTTGEVNTLEQAEKALIANGQAYIQMMLAKAAAQLALEEAAKAALKAEQDRLKKESEFLTKGDRFLAGSTQVSAPGFVPGLNEAAARQQAQFLEDQSNKRKAAAIKVAEDEAKTFEKIAQTFQENAAKISKQYGFDFFGGKDKKTGASRLDAADQDELKRIDAVRRQQIALENKRKNEIEKVRDLSFDEEITYYQNIQNINIGALNSSINIFERKKKLNAEELQTLAEFQEQQSSIYLQTSKKINDIESKRFDQQEQQLKNDLEFLVKSAEAKNRLIQEDPNLSATDKAQAELDKDRIILEAQISFFNKLQALNDKFNKEATRKAQQAIEGNSAAIQEASKKVYLAEIDDIEAQGARKVKATENNYAILRKKILDNDKLTLKQKNKQLEALDQAENRTVLSIELETLNKEVAKKKELLALSLISEAEYQDALNRQAKKAEQVSKATPQNAAPKVTQIKSLQEIIQGGQSGSGGLRSVFKVKEGSDGDQAIGIAIAESFNVAQEAMANYFDAERERIEESKKLALERLDIEKAQVLNRAQSRAEEASIEKQFAAKKKKIEQDAFEKQKDIKKKEAKIAFLMELANIWSTAFQLGPIAGPILGAILSGLAIARYASTVSSINQQKFEMGGEVPTRGGRFGGKPHSQGGTPFVYGGNQYEAEVGELAIIRTKNAPGNQLLNLVGTHTQIASKLNELGGGISFAPGAKMKKFAYGGNLGESLQPPVFVPSAYSNTIVSSSGISEERFERFMNEVKGLAIEQSRRIDRMEVIQVTSSVTAAQKKQVKQAEIGTL